MTTTQATPLHQRWAGVRRVVRVNTSLRVDPKIWWLARIAAGASAATCSSMPFGSG